MSFGCVANTIRLLSGHYFDLANPQPEDFETQDVSGALSKMCRFGGQIERFYSVAEHLVHCARQAKADGHGGGVQLACLLHDAAEAFVGDVVRPLKNMLRGYAEVEAAAERAIAAKYGVDFTKHKATVKEIDNAMLIAERKALFSRDNVEWAGESQVRVLSPDIRCWGPAEAQLAFEATLLSLQQNQ